MVLVPPDIPSDSPAAKIIHVRQLPMPVFPPPSKQPELFYTPERNQSTRILDINISFTLPLVYALLMPEGSELGPLCETVTLRRKPHASRGNGVSKGEATFPYLLTTSEVLGTGLGAAGPARKTPLSWGLLVGGQTVTQ